MNNQPQQPQQPQPPSNQQGPQYYPPQSQQGGQSPRLPQIGGRGGMSQWVIIAVVAVIVVCGGLALLRNLGPGASSQPLPVPTSPSTSGNPSGGTGSSTGGPQLGRVVTASSIGQQNAPGNVTGNFPANAPVIYVVIEGTYIPQGSTFFARWFRDNQPFEDSPQITADKDYNNTYIEFHLQPEQAGALQPGNYGVQIFVNGNPGPSTAFTVQ